jgi:N-acetylmuramic acid 6-phosphate (MurNAc-6-P) etherase
MADSERRILKTERDEQDEAVKIARLLVGLTVADAQIVLRTCEGIIRSAIVITDSNADAIAAEFQLADEK